MEEYLKTWRAMEEDMEMNSSKKRKVFADQLENEYGGEVESPENSVSPAASMTSGCRKHEEYYSSDDVVKKSLRSPDLENVDLQSDAFETENSTSVDYVFSREATPTSELYYGDSEQILLHPSSSSEKKSSTPPAISRRKIAENMPSPAELEEFFAAAENYEQKRFIEKYNYDIVKDVPLEGKYQWVRLQL